MREAYNETGRLTRCKIASMKTEQEMISSLKKKSEECRVQAELAKALLSKKEAKSIEDEIEGMVTKALAYENNSAEQINFVTSEMRPLNAKYPERKAFVHWHFHTRRFQRRVEMLTEVPEALCGTRRLSRTDKRRRGLILNW